jgi:hypothetical protein
LNEGWIVGGKPIATRRHPTALFDPVEESLDIAVVEPLPLFRPLELGQAA